MIFTELMGNVGVFGLGVMGCLLALSIYSVGLILDRHRRYRSASRESQEIKPVLGKHLRAGEIREAMELAKQHTGSYVAQVVSAGIQEYDVAREDGLDADASLELVTSALEHAKAESLIELKRGLGLLATIGSTAPFIGLFGTVVGIINAFRGIAATGSGGMAVVSGGIAEALVATALGIFVAIPAVVSFNLFTGRLEQFHVEMNRASSELVNFLFKVAEARQPEVKTKETRTTAVKAEVAHAAR